MFVFFPPTNPHLLLLSYGTCKTIDCSTQPKADEKTMKASINGNSVFYFFSVFGCTVFGFLLNQSRMVYFLGAEQRGIVYFI